MRPATNLPADEPAGDETRRRRRDPSGRYRNRLGHARNGDRIVAFECTPQGRHQQIEILGDFGLRRVGDRPADAINGGQQQVDVVATHLEPAVTQRAEQVFGRVRGLQHLGQAHHAG